MAILENAGFLVETAENGAVAVEKVCQAFLFKIERMVYLCFRYSLGLHPFIFANTLE